MGVININKNEEFILGIWRVEEDEASLKVIVGGTDFPGLAKINHPRRRLEWLAARSLLREFGYNGHVLYHPTRRPFLAESHAHLSISHSFPYVAVLLSNSFSVGVDVESFNRPFVEVSDKYLSIQEKKWVDLNDNHRLALIWSAKEALYKLPGMEGLTGADMDIKPIDSISSSGVLNATIRLGGTIQKFELNYFYIGNFNVVWVHCNPKILVW